VLNMSKLETPLTREYWRQVGGTLVEEFLVVNAGDKVGKRLLDGIIVFDGKNRIARKEEVDLNDKDVVVIQTKARRLGMYLLGQAVFSKFLIEKYFNPKSVKSVALCTEEDEVLQDILSEHFSGVEIVVMDKDSNQNY